MPLNNTFGKILVTTDGVDYDSVAVTTAIALAKAYNSILIALSVVDTRVLEDFKGESQAFIHKIQIEMLEGCTKALDKIEEQARHHKINMEKVVRTGKPHIEIVQEATKRDVNLIILERKSHAGGSKSRLGGVIERVIEDADCSVLVIR
jgi:nucleotide-binding universal stress UspA family protein